MDLPYQQSVQPQVLHTATRCLNEALRTVLTVLSFSTDFEPSVSNQPPTTKKNRTGLIVGIVVGVGVISLISLFAAYYLIQKRKQQKALEDEGKKCNLILYGFSVFDFQVIYLSLSLTATWKVG